MCEYSLRTGMADMGVVRGAYTRRFSSAESALGAIHGRPQD